MPHDAPRTPFPPAPMFAVLADIETGILCRRRSASHRPARANLVGSKLEVKVLDRKFYAESLASSRGSRSRGRCGGNRTPERDWTLEQDEEPDARDVRQRPAAAPLDRGPISPERKEFAAKHTSVIRRAAHDAGTAAGTG